MAQAVSNRAIHRLINPQWSSPLKAKCANILDSIEKTILPGAIAILIAKPPAARSGSPGHVLSDSSSSRLNPQRAEAMQIIDQAQRRSVRCPSVMSLHMY